MVRARRLLPRLALVSLKPTAEVIIEVLAGNLSVSHLMSVERGSFCRGFLGSWREVMVTDVHGCPLAEINGLALDRCFSLVGFVEP
ncbi:unnamed protein product [[Actinomadura] parvosata subsp. kistnae]|uniref:hypothetical protein n=1 Tax=[Actinomadura] parvosata TaxID=1955412 RepID=UPI000D2E1AE9|nr:unnamed protein product [Actinomadura parvosata subsp. kistnae]